MMRWLLLAVLVVALTAGATVAIQFLPASTEAEKGLKHQKDKVAENAGPPGVAEVDGGLIYDFGTMAQYSKDHHEWVIKNVGQGDLRLAKGPSSCSCTIASLKEGETAIVKPGEDTTIKLEWETKDNNGQFGHYAEILTPDDPNRQTIKFIVRGIVAPAIVLVPPGKLVPLMNVPNDESSRAHFIIHSPDKEDLDIISITSSKPDLITATATPLTNEDRGQLNIASKGGYRIEVEVKPGMPLGLIREQIVLKTNHPKEPQVRMTVTGKAIGPISMTPDHLRLTTISGSQTANGAVNLWVRGRDATKFEVLKAPPNLKVQVTAFDENAKTLDPNANAKRYRLIVTVPPGTPPGVIDGTLILKTDHPGAGEVRIPVTVTVQAAG